ncbi:hypothetical protein CBDKU1_39150 [Clostridium butyricum DKU-01]|nr:hypothetical protein CBDKU1_39150 [Clostridium butyricum DKU-01]
MVKEVSNVKKRVVIAIIQNSLGEYLLCQRDSKDDMGNL